jgi:hypothetical protein
VDLAAIERAGCGIPAVTVRDRPVVLFAGEWQLNSARRQFTGLVFEETGNVTRE